MINVLLWFDTEDYITPSSDDALFELLKLLSSRNVRGTFKIVGEKARQLKARQRHDILSLLKEHEIGYHTDYHSVPPSVSEYLEGLSFRAGVKVFDERERNGLEDLQSITGMRCFCYGQPGYAWAPQTFPVLKHWGMEVYLDVHDQVTLDHKPFWYGGMLNLTDLFGTMRMELEPGGLERAKREFARLCDELPVDNRFISIYYHPCEFSTLEFWDGVNFAEGANPSRDHWKPAAERPAEEMAYYLQKLGEFLDYTLATDDIRYLTASDMLNEERSSQGTLTEFQVVKLAEQMGSQLDFTVMDGHSMSAADLFRCFYRHLSTNEFPSDTLYGPENHVDSQLGRVSVRRIKQALQTDYPSIYAWRQLPDAFVVDGRQVNPVDMTCTMAYVMANSLPDEAEVSMVKGTLCPAAHVRTTTHWGKRWPIFPRDLEVPNLVRQAGLQAWTLKPALF